MNNKLALVLFMFLSLVQAQAMDEVKDDGLYLVVGSTRQKGPTTQLFETMVGQEVDFSHTKTFEGRATTLDILPCAIPGQRHIKHDATKFKPKNNVPIRAVYMELFPATEKCKTGILSFLASKTQPPEEYILMPRAMENLAQYMCDGATLEIEIWPNISTSSENEQLGKYSKSVDNPFYFLTDPSFFTRAICALIDEPHSNEWNWMFNKGELTQAIENVGKLLNLNHEEVKRTVNKERNQYLDNHLFFESTPEALSIYIMQEFAMINRQILIEPYLEKIGFKDIKIDRRTSPANGRKNMWIISAIRVR